MSEKRYNFNWNYDEIKKIATETFPDLHVPEAVEKLIDVVTEVSQVTDISPILTKIDLAKWSVSFTGIIEVKAVDSEAAKEEANRILGMEDDIFSVVCINDAKIRSIAP